jgi:aryl-alcohol dehydrogenase-like predicted oxidoreductase
LKEDAYAKTKYDSTSQEDNKIIMRVSQLATNYEVSMTEISLAWLETKVTSPIVGATKYHHVDGAANSVELKLTKDDINYLEELYTPHKLVGVMADNNQKLNEDKKVWMKHAPQT